MNSPLQKRLLAKPKSSPMKLGIIEPAAEAAHYPIFWAKVGSISSEDSIFRILPPWTKTGPNAYLSYRESAQHWGFGQKPFFCRKEIGFCPACDLVYQMQRGDTALREASRNFIAKKVFLYQVIDRNEPLITAKDASAPELENLPKISVFSAPKTAHDGILDYTADSSYGDITSPLAGFDIRLRRINYKGKEIISVKLASEVKTPLFSMSGGLTPNIEIVKSVLQIRPNLEKHPFFQPPSEQEMISLVTEIAKQYNLRLSSKKSVSTIETKPEQLPSFSLAPQAQQQEERLQEAQQQEERLQETKEAQSQEEEIWRSQYPSHVDDFQPSSKKEDLAMLEKWRAKKGGYEARSVEEMAKILRVSEKQILVCYGWFPNHRSRLCWKCALSTHCVAVYYTEEGRFSIRESSSEEPKTSNVLQDPL